MLTDDKNYTSLISSYKEALAVLGAELLEIGCFDYQKAPVQLYGTIMGNGPTKVLITSGIHGEERAGPYGLLEFIKSDIQKYLDRFTFHIIPVINPIGFEKSERFGSSGMDINRLFDMPQTSPEVKITRNFLHHLQFQLFIDLHEDSDSDHVYLYESGDGLNDDLILAEDLNFLSLISKRGIVINQEPFIYGAVSRNGIVYKGYQTPGKSGEQIDGTIADYLLTSKRVIRAITLETPGKIEFNSRVRVQKDFLNFILAPK